MKSTRIFHANRLLCTALAIFLAISTAFMAALSLPHTAVAADGDGSDQGGYWQLSGSPVVVSNKKNSGGTTEKRDPHASIFEHTLDIAIKYTNETTPDHWDWDTNSWRLGTSNSFTDYTLEEATFTATCSAPPERVAADDYITLHLTLNVENKNIVYYFYEVFASALYGSADYSIEGKDASSIAYSMTSFGPVTEDGPDGCSVATIPDHTMNKQVTSCDVQYKFHDPEAKHGGILSLGAGESPTTMRIAFYACSSITIWEYKWVPRTGEDETVVTPYVNQTVNVNASNTSGNQNVGKIDDDITLPGGAIAIPIAIIGIGAIAGGLVLRKRSRKGTNNRQDDNRQPERANYNMVIYKNFGDTMVPGRTYDVCARIDKQVLGANGMPAGPATPVSQMTSQIRVSPVQNLNVISAAYQPPYMVGRVQIPNQPTNITTYPEAVVRFTYASTGGAFNAQVAFKVKANARIEFCDEKGETLSRTKAVVDMLAGDMQGVTCYFEAVDFADKPQVTFDVSDSRLQTTLSEHIVPTNPNGFYYKLEMKWTEAPFNRYDSWPYPAYIDIHAKTDIQNADGRVDAKAWYDGIGVDIKHLDSEKQFAGDAIIINTSDFIETKEADYNIKETAVGVVAAFKNKQGQVEVFAPNRPTKEEFARIEAAETDADAIRIFSKDDPRFWYDLKVSSDTIAPSTDDHRIGTASIKPFFPLLLDDETECFRGTLQLAYIDKEEGIQVDGEINYIVRGMDEGGYLETREQEIRAISRILAGMNATGMEEAYQLLAQYGGQSERARIKLGNDEKRAALAETSQSIMAKVNNIHSVQRLRFMRQELFNAAVAYNKNDGLTIAGIHYTWQDLADYADSCYKIALLSRWATDIMFTVWWYLLLKTKAAYVEPIMTPLKNWILDYCEMLSTFALDPDEEYQTIEQFFSARNYYYKVLVPTIEGEFFSIVVAQATTHGTVLLTNPRGLTLVGSVFAFMFANQCMANAKKDPKTGKIEIDFWDALKKTTLKMTKFTLKVVLSVILARKFFDMFKTSGGRPPAPFPDPQTARQKMLNCLYKGLGDVMGPLTQNVKTEWGKGAVEGIEGSIIQDEAVNFVQAVFVDAPTGYFIDGAKDIENWSQDAPKKEPNNLDWLRSFGEIIPVDVIDETTGKPQTIYVPLLTGAYIFIDDLLVYLGVDELRCLSMDYSTVLPDKCPYKTRDEMIRLLKERRITTEAEWLAEPHYEIAGNYVGPSMDDRDSIVPQIVPHTIYR